MTKRELGNASYGAVRIGPVVRIRATGTAPNFNTKPDIEQLPFRIYPPMFGFFFVHPAITIPATRPFVYEEDVAYPLNQSSIIIIDSSGRNEVAIHELVVPAINAKVENATGEFCVFQWIGKDTFKIAECSAIVPTVYARVFGPATIAACEEYVSKEGRT